MARLRILNGRDIDLVADATRAANRLCDALLAVSPVLERAVGERLMSTPGLRAALATWPTPTVLRTAGKARVRTLMSRRSKRTAATLTAQIWAALGAQTVTVVAESTWGETIGDLAADLEGIIAVRQRLEADIEEAFLEHPLGKVLNSMCGFGPRTGVRTLAEIGDPHRFANPARLAAYAGLAPMDRQSGRSHTTGRSQGGNHRLHNAMFIAAFVATQHDPDARAYYQPKRAQDKEHNAALSCVARRRCNIILAMLKTQTPYQPAKPRNCPTRLDNKTGTPPSGTNGAMSIITAALHPDLVDWPDTQPVRDALVPVVNALREQDRVIATLDDLAELLPGRAPQSTARALREAGWLFRMRTRGVWEFAGSRLGAPRTPGYLELHARMRVRPDTPACIAGKTVAMLHGCLRNAC
ncbi:MAG: transposase [bacterium]|nr:transposase [bacterium]